MNKKRSSKPEVPAEASVSTKTDSERLVPVRREDHLSEDDPVTGQQYACVSFVSPRDVVPDKNAYFFERYVSEVFVTKADAFVEAVTITPEKAVEFARGFKDDIREVCQDFEAFLSSSQTKLEADFASTYPDYLATSGFKVRGSYPTMEAARKRAETLRDQDGSVDVFVAQVGAWCPFNPSPESVGDVEYHETELNTLMKLKKEAEERKDDAYKASKEDRVAKAKLEGQGKLGSIIEEVDEGAEESDIETTSGQDENVVGE